jgi:AP-3 complex subunit mu
MIHTLFILNNRGDIVIEKHWRTATSRSAVEFFWAKVQACAHPKDVPPVMTGPKHYLINVFRGNMYYLATVTCEVAPLMVIELLHRVADVFVQYFSKATEDVLKQNFATIFQLLDEILDNGYPYITEPNALTSLIAPPTLAQKVVSAVTGKSGVSQKFGGGMLTNMPWRTGGVKYTNNEIYFDIVEEVSAVLDQKGKALYCNVDGKIECNSRLSGTPDLELLLSHPTVLDDVAFHPCVRHSPWVKKKVISFVPPDGKFLLCTYRLANQAQIYPPFFCKKDIHFGVHSGRIELMVGDRPGSNLQKVASMKGKSLATEELKIVIPFPSFVTSTDLKVDHGKCTYDEHTKVCVWDVGTIGSESPKLTGTMKVREVPEGTVRLERLPMTVHFRVPKATVSGLEVANMFLGESETYKPFRGVRAVVKSGKYQLRVE